MSSAGVRPASEFRPGNSLISAIRAGDAPLVEAMLAAGASAAVLDSSGREALEHAQGNALIQSIIDKHDPQAQARVLARASATNMKVLQALLGSIRSGDADGVSAALAAGASCDMLDANGRGAWEYANERGDKQIKALLEANGFRRDLS
jgi:ankyrin repeat protein